MMPESIEKHLNASQVNSKICNTHLNFLSTLEKKTRDCNISFVSVQQEQFLLVQGLEQ